MPVTPSSLSAKQLLAALAGGQQLDDIGSHHSHMHSGASGTSLEPTGTDRTLGVVGDVPSAIGAMALGIPSPMTTDTTTSAVSSRELAKHITDDIYHTIVRIVVHSTTFDYELPFKIKGNSLSSGTGFFIDKQGHILTCSHVVEDASHVYIEIPSEGKKQYKAEVRGICPFFDLAVIRILDYANTHSCTLDESIGSLEDDAVKSGDETFALGFPLGQDNLKVTKGIVSGQQHRMYQIDTPINPGNSGGPLLKNGKVIGVNGAGVMLANNIGYAVPVSRFFLIKDLLYQPKRLIHYPEIFGFEYQRTCPEFVDFFGYQCAGTGTGAPTDLSSPRTSERCSRRSGRRASRSNRPPSSSSSSRRASQAFAKVVTARTKPKTAARGGCTNSGIYIKRTFRKSPVSATGMREGDFVCALNGVGVDHYGELDRRWMNQKMDMANMLCTLPLGKKVTVDYWSKKHGSNVRKAFVLKEYAMPVRHLYPQFEPVDYETLGGFVAMPLTLDHAKGLFVQGRIKKYAQIEHRHEPKVVVSAVLMGSYVAQQRTLVKNEILKEVNDCPVATMDDFRKAVSKPLRKGKRHYLKLLTEERNVAIIPVATIHQEEKHLQEVYKYPASKLLGKLARV